MMAGRGSRSRKRGGHRARRVLIVDDHAIVRFGLRRLIEQEKDLAVCGEAETTEAAKAAIRELKPDVVIVDITLGPRDGIELIKATRADNPALPILVLSMHDESIYAERMLSAGASGYIMKQAPSGELLAALRRVLERRVYVSEQVGENIVKGFATRGARSVPNPLDRLSNRELQILHTIARGMSTRQAAEALGISVKTIESHRERIKRKLNLASGSQLLRYAVDCFSGREAERLPVGW